MIFWLPTPLHKVKMIAIQNNDFVSQDKNSEHSQKNFTPQPQVFILWKFEKEEKQSQFDNSTTSLPFHSVNQPPIRLCDLQQQK